MKVELTDIGGCEAAFKMSCLNCGDDLYATDDDMVRHPTNSRKACQFQGKTVKVPVVIEVPAD